MLYKTPSSVKHKLYQIKVKYIPGRLGARYWVRAFVQVCEPKNLKSKLQNPTQQIWKFVHMPTIQCGNDLYSFCSAYKYFGPKKSYQQTENHFHVFFYQKLYLQFDFPSQPLRLERLRFFYSLCYLGGRGPRWQGDVRVKYKLSALMQLPDTNWCENVKQTINRVKQHYSGFLCCTIVNRAWCVAMQHFYQCVWVK